MHLVGRDAELSELRRLIAGLDQGVGFQIVVHGGAGIGKSALLDRLATDAAESAQILRGGGTQREAELAFSGLAELLASTSVRIGELASGSSAVLRAALTPSAVGKQRDVEVFAALSDVFDRLAEDGPVVCLIDDAQWFDAASLDSVLFAARRLAHRPVGFVFATRDDVVSRLDTSAIPRLAVPALDPAAALDVVRAVDPALSRQAMADVVALAEGYPLALVEFASHVPSKSTRALLGGGEPLPVSARIERVFGDRASALDDEARQALLVLVAAESSGSDVVRRAVATLVDDPARALDAVVDAGLAVRRPGGPYVIRHPLVRSAVYQSAPEAQRRAVHAALAAAGDTDPDRVAWHRALAADGADEQIAADLESTARSARRRGGCLAEARALELAARLSPDHADATRRLLGAGAAAVDAGRQAFARALLNEVLTRSDDPRAIADAEHRLAQIDFWQDGVVSSRVIDTAERVASREPERAAQLLSFALVPLISDGRPDEALPIARRAWELIDHAIRPFDVAFRVAHVLVMAGDPDAVSLTNRAAAAAEEAGDVNALVMISQPLWWIERYDRARQLLAVATVEARRSGAIWLLAHALINQAELDRRLGRLRSAQVAATEAAAIAEELAEPMQHAEALAQLAAAEAEIGDAIRAQAHAEQALRAVADRAAGSTELRVTAAAALARVALGAGRPTAAVTHLKPLVDAVINSGLRDPGPLTCISDLFDALAAAGQHADAAQLADWLTHAAESCDRRWALLAAARGRQLAMAANTDVLAQALDADDRATPLLTARALLTLGEHLRRGGERTRARAALTEAQQLFHASDAGAWDERLIAELRACGEPVAAAGTPRLLTPQEDRIARLAATGARNREIAQTLSLSEKTVETHLAGAFRKLGVRSRTELAARLADLA